MTISRRRLLTGIGGAVVTAVGGAGCTPGGHPAGPHPGESSFPHTDPEVPPGQPALAGRQLVTPRPPRRFVVPLPTPPVLKPERTTAGTDYYSLTTKVARAEILPGQTTEIWGYDGRFPGPTIEARSGRQVVVRTTNELPVPTVTHLHGGVTPPESDGYPTDLILPAAGWDGHQHDGDLAHGVRDYTYPLRQRAATLWYHDHRMNFTGPQVWRGLVGAQIVRDEIDDGLPLPKGDRELLLTIADRSFDAEGQLVYPSLDPSLRSHAGVSGDFHQGVLGDVILVNGAPWPVLEVEAARYRVRLLNASNARHYRLALTGGGSFVQVGSDQGLLGAPVALRTIDIAPAERFDVVIDFGGFRPGTKVVLRNERGTGGTADVMQFVVARRARDDSTVPAVLDPSFEPLSAALGRQPDRKFSFLRAMVDGHWVWRIERREFNTSYIHADPALGSTEMWQFVSDTEHPVHLHLARFQVVQRLGGPASYATDGGWKDTVRLEPNKVVRILVRFDGYRGKYVFHCHNLEHEDMAMMANFQVT